MRDAAHPTETKCREVPLVIVPMKKVSLVVQEKHRDKALRQLRKAGVIHLEKKTVSSDSLSKLLDRKVKAETALGLLQPYAKDVKKAVPKVQAPAIDSNAKPKGYNPHNRRAEDQADPSYIPFSSDELNGPDMQDIVAQVLDYADERKSLQDRFAQLGRERSRIEEWGNFNPHDFTFLSEKAGLNLFLYKFPKKGYKNPPEDTRYMTLGEDKNSVRLLVLDKELPGESPVPLSDFSLGEIDNVSSDVVSKLAAIENDFIAMSGEKARIERELKVLQGRIDFETACAGMETLADVPEESTVSWITGFVPQEDLGVLKRSAAENNWALAAVDPGPDDMVPTKLKNNRFVSLLKPLTDFLEVSPGYHEADISPWFLIFFTIFFGMIFGDAAYGAIFVIAAVVGIFKTMKKGVPPILKLLLLLGCSNFIWGVLTCSWFGVDIHLLPAFLRNISLPLISNVTSAKSDYDAGIVQQNLMIFCFTLALLQLSIGHIIALSRTKSLKILADLGSIFMLIGMYVIVLILIASNGFRNLADYIPMMPFVYLFFTGFLINFVFANYEGSVGKSIVESLKNFISMVLGIANVFSDIMSYIRLWAVGLAGAAISSTVNAMAGPILGHFIFFILGILLLIFGHGLNIVLNALSVLVHGVRLNTLEFSSHVGLTWAGTAYKPFSESGIPHSREVSESSR